VERLDRHPAAETKVFRKPDFGHAAGSEQPLEAVSSIDDVRCGERQVILQQAFSRERAVELALLTGPLLLLGIGWRSLAAAGFELPGSMVRIVTQAALCVIAMHAAVRFGAPRARPELLPLVAVLALLGIVMVARLAPGSAGQQANWLAVGFAAFAGGIAAGRMPQRLRSLTYTSGLLAVLVLVATGIFGETINGARLWLRVAGQSVQTTEFIKAFLVLFLAGYLADAGGALSRPLPRVRAATVPGAVYVLPLALVLAGAVLALALLRDLGSIALLLLLAIALVYVATGRAVFAFIGAGLVIATGMVGYAAFGHVQARVDAWLDPGADPAGAGYQSLQATYAVNAGGILGEGLGRGVPDVVPAASTDYVYVAVAEELGMAGAAGVALVYLALLHAGLRVAAEARDSYTRLLAAAVALLIGIQAAVIIAGNLRLIPTTGITLPFVSYGGSSLVVNLGLVGLLLGLSHTSRAGAAPQPG
jgi:cell division protein FtsW